MSSMDVHSPFEHARRYLSVLLAHFSDDLAFSAPTESKMKHVAMEETEGAVSFTSPFLDVFISNTPFNLSLSRTS